MSFSLRPYRTFSSYLKEKFGVRVQKISVDAGFTCPNRDGVKGIGGCLYCNAVGSGIGKKQIKELKEHIQGRLTALKQRQPETKALLYFQAFTNTYAPINELKEIYDLVFLSDQIVGISIGTRPDCVSEDILKLIHSYTKHKEVWIEYGIETAHNHTQQLINRLHTFEDCQSAFKITRNFPQIKTCVHLILGLPNESRKNMIETIQKVIQLGINSIKIHNLYIEKTTPLYHYYQKTPFQLISFEEYVDILKEIINLLPPHIIIQRINGEARKGFLFAPQWASDEPYKLGQKIEKELQLSQVYQGNSFFTSRFS